MHACSYGLPCGFLMVFRFCLYHAFVFRVHNLRLFVCLAIYLYTTYYTLCFFFPQLSLDNSIPFTYALCCCCCFFLFHCWCLSLFCCWWPSIAIHKFSSYFISIHSEYSVFFPSALGKILNGKLWRYLSQLRSFCLLFFRPDSESINYYSSTSCLPAVVLCYSNTNRLIHR